LMYTYFFLLTKRKRVRRDICRCPMQGKNKTNWRFLTPL
jgi:hypothetical protein